MLPYLNMAINNSGGLYVSVACLSGPTYTVHKCTIISAASLALYTKLTLNDEGNSSNNL